MTNHDYGVLAKEGENLLKMNELYNMDCMEGMKLLDDNSIDSIVTDPPYELGFMGKSWDSTGIAYNIEVWKECLRVLKPGGHLLAFGGTRTYHRMACAIEDAGFEIRDQMQWIYGSGFPKSHNISKAIDKKAGAERKVVGLTSSPNGNVGGYQGERYKEKRQTRFGVVQDQPEKSIPSTEEAKQWDGWGTALKPANEPIVVARKPLSEKTVAENVLKWGTGGINIDDCRIPTEDKLGGGVLKGSVSGSDGWDRPWRHNEEAIKSKIERAKEAVKKGETLGRFPANVILDEEAGKMLDEQSGISKSTGGSGEKSRGALGKNVYGKYSLNVKASNSGGLGDIGGASRYFYCAKASRKERGEGNNHPTVKPLSLIKYLVTLVTPPNGICLDPFEGSGTHAIACINAKRNFIGFEIDPDYYKAAKERLEAVKNQVSMFAN